MSNSYKYFAFISYSRKDSKAAAWLQKRLEWFQFPIKLVQEDRRPPDTRYIRPIYRDKTNLEVTDEHYWYNIRRALEESRFLIVLASPHSGCSRPVDMEVYHFLDCHEWQSSLVVPVILGGSVTSSDDDAALCSTLRYFSEEITGRNLPTMVPDGIGTELDAWEAGFVSLISYLLQLDRGAVGDHIQREARKQTRTLYRWFALVGATSIIAMLAMGIAYHYQMEAVKDRAEAMMQTKAADEERTKKEEMLWNKSWADLESGITAHSAGKYSEAITYFDRSLEHRPDNISALIASANFTFGPSSSKWRVRSVKDCSSPPSSVAFSPDGRLVAVGTRGQIAKIIETRTGQTTHTIKCKYPVSSIAFSRDSTRLMIGCADADEDVPQFYRYGNLYMCDVHTGKILNQVDLDEPINVVSIDRGGKYIAIGTGNLSPIRGTGHAYVYDASSLRPVISKFEENLNSRVSSVAFNSKGDILAIANSGMAVTEIPSGKVLAKHKLGIEPGWPYEANSVAFSPDDRFIVCGSKDSTVRLFDAKLGTEKWRSIITDVSPVICVCYSPDGTQVAAASGRELQVFEAESGKLKWNVELPVGSMTFSPDGRWLAVGYPGDRTMHVFDAFTGKEVFRLPLGGRVTAIAFSEDGQYLAICSDDHSFRLMEAWGQTYSERIDMPDMFNSMSIANNRVAMASEQPMLIDLNTGTRQPFGSRGLNGPQCFSSDGTRLAFAAKESAGTIITPGVRNSFNITFKENSSVHFVDTETGKDAASTALWDEVLSLSYQQDSHVCAVGCKDGTVATIDDQTGEFSTRYKLGNPITSVFWAKGGQLCAMTMPPGNVQLYDVQSNQLIKTLTTTTDTDLAAIDQNLRFCATARRSGSLLVRSLNNSNSWAYDVGSQVLELTFSKDGNLLLSGGVNGCGNVFQTDTGHMIASLQLGYSAIGTGFSEDGRTLYIREYYSLLLINSNWVKTADKLSRVWRAALCVQSGTRTNLGGSFGILSAKDLEAAADQVLEFVNHSPSSHETWQHKILKWCEEPPLSRPVSPWGSEMAVIAIGRQLMQANPLSPTIKKASDMFPSHPLSPISLARQSKTRVFGYEFLPEPLKSGRVQFLVRLTLKRLSEAELSVYSRKILGDYAAWCADVIHNELHFDKKAQDQLHFYEEASDALAIALKYSTPDKKEHLLDLKAKIEGK